MKKLLYILILFFLSINCYSQQPPVQVPRSQWFLTWIKVQDSLRSDRGYFQKVLQPPLDTAFSKLGFAQISNKVYYGNGVKWTLLSSDSLTYATRRWVDSVIAVNQPVLDSNLVVQLGPGGTNGGLNTGDTLPGGTTLDAVFRRLLIKAIHPTYTAPTAGISSSPGGGLYEIGTNIGTVTLSSTFTQNDAGSLSTTTYYQNGSSLGGNTTTISSLTSQQSFYVNKAYAQGACKNNNLGVQDCYGRITAGGVNSGTIYITPFYYRYWGWVSSSSPSDSTVQGLNKDGNGLSLTVTNTTPSGSQYFVYYHSTSLGSISTITVNGFPSTSAFTITTVTFTNAQGYASSYERIISNNALSATSTITFN